MATKSEMAQQIVAEGGALPSKIIEHMGWAAPQVFGAAALKQLDALGPDGAVTAARAALAVEHTPDMMALVNTWGEATVQSVIDSGDAKSPSLVSQQVTAMMKAAMPSLADRIAVRDPYLVAMEAAFRGAPEFPATSDPKLVSSVGRAVPGVYGRAAEDQLASPERAQDMVGLVNLLGERAVDRAISMDATLEPAATAEKMRVMLAAALPTMYPEIGVRDPLQVRLDRAYDGQPGFTAMAQGLSALAAVPASGLPSNQGELAQQIQAATYQKLRDMWSTDGIGKALHEAQARLPHFKARLLDQRVVQYAAASVVSSMALAAAGRVEMDAPSPPLPLTFHDEWRGAYSGQVDMTLTAIHEGRPVGRIDYSIYEGQPHIQMIDVKMRRCGVGTALVSDLQERFPGQEITWGTMTEDGARLYASLPMDSIPNPEAQEMDARLNALLAVQSEIDGYATTFRASEVTESTRATFDGQTMAALQSASLIFDDGERPQEVAGLWNALRNNITMLRDGLSATTPSTTIIRTTASSVHVDAPRAMPRGTQEMLTALQDKTMVQAWAVYESADGQLRPHQIARAGMGVHPSSTLASDVVNFCGDRAVEMGRSELTPAVKAQEMAPMVPVMQALGRVGDPEQHLMFGAVAQGLPLPAPRPGPAIGEMPKSYSEPDAPRQAVLSDLMEAAAHAVARRRVEAEPEVEAFKRARGIGAPGLPD